MIDELTEFLTKPREISTFSFDGGEEFKVYDIPLRAVDLEVTDVVSMKRWRIIRVVRNDRFPTESDIVSVEYEVFPDESRDRNYTKRYRACHQLATKMVNELLPNVSMRVRTELHNAEVDEILSVLDG